MKKIQNQTTFDQAEMLDNAIREAGLEWPKIQWDCMVYEWAQNLEGRGTKLVLRVCEVDAINEEQPPAFKYIPVGLPAPNLAELAAMIPLHIEYNLEPDQITIEGLLDIVLELLMNLCDGDIDEVKDHWREIE